MAISGHSNYIKQQAAADIDMNTFKLRTIVTLAALLLSVSISAKADGLTFSNLVALQNNGTTQIDLFSAPQSNLYGSQLSFFVTLGGTLPPSGIDVLRLTFAEDGQTPVVQEFPIPFFPQLGLPYIQQFVFTPQHPTFQGTPITLTVDIVGSATDFVIPSGLNQGSQVNSYTYSFNSTNPVPEPVTSGFFLLGVSAIITRARRYKS